MAQPERNMAEGGLSSETNPSPLASAGPDKAFPKVQYSPGFVPQKAAEYTPVLEGRYMVYKDPSGKEVARIANIKGGEEDDERVKEVAKLIEEAEKEVRELGPEHWMTMLQELHEVLTGGAVLTDAERKTKEDEYSTACQRLAKFAHSEKLFENSFKVTILEKQLNDFEEKEIEKGPRTEKEKEVLRDLLDDFEKQQIELDRVEKSLKLKEKAPYFFTEKEWQELEAREKELRTGPHVSIDSLRAEIGSMTSSDFLSKRSEKKEDIKKAKEMVEKEQEQKEQQKLGELRDEPDKLLEDKKPNLNVLPSVGLRDSLTSLADPANPDYVRAQEALEWYFHKARELEFFTDLEDRLDQKYEEWMAAIIPHREINPDGSGRITQKTFSEIQDEIIEYFGVLLDPGKAQYVEHSSRWNLLQRQKGGIDISEWQGIRAELVRRAQIQIEDSLSNQDQQLRSQRQKKAPPTSAPINRLSGEWNVYRLERKIREDQESQESQESSRPLFRHESYYSIDLLGRDREEIELGADQAADYIIGSATTFDLKVVQQRMELLTQGIERKIGTIEISEEVSKEEAKKIIQEIQRAVTNKLDFFILNWTATYVLMDQFAGYYSDRFRMDGEQKIKAIPAMNDGQVGLAIHWLNSPLYELYHRPQGFKGQLYDDDQTHKFERKLMKEQIIKKLMEYELKGKDYQERAKNRSELKKGPTIHEFLLNFDHKRGGVIPPGVIPEDLITSNAAGKKDPTEYFKDLSWEERLELFNKLKSDQIEQLFNLFDQLTPDEKVDIRRFQYLTELQGVKAKRDAVTPEDLARVRVARKMLAKEQNKHQDIRRKAESAFDTADTVLNIFGEAAYLGAPSIIMENGDVVMNDDFARESSGFTKEAEKRFQNLTKKQAGTSLSNKEKKDLESLQQVKDSYEKLIQKRGDFISINDYKIAQKYAILQAGQGLIVVTDASNKQYRIDDNLAMIRYRAKKWIKRWKDAGLDRSQTPREFDITITLPDGTKTKTMVKLAAGFEETGLTQAEWDAFQKTDKQFKEKGYQMDVEGIKLADIKKKDELEPVLNNFLVDYKSSESEINDPYVIENAARGRMVSIANIRKRLGFSGRQRLEGTTQQQIDEYTQRVEDSRSFDAELERLAYFAATHDLSQPPMMTERGKPVYKFSADRIDYGYQRQSWGVKRLHHLKAFWYTNLRRTVPRAADLVHAMPFSLTSLRRELAFDSFLQMCWEVGRMESIDNPALVAMGNRHQDMGVIRGGGEGSISDREWKKVWGFFEKPLVDANSAWTLMQIVANKDTRDSLESVLKGTSRIDLDTREKIINHLQEVTFSRFVPILVATEKSMGEDRQALSAGSGYEENNKFALRFLEWLMSEKSGDDRGQGGLKVQPEIVDIIKLITMPNSYRKGASLWDEFWRKQTPSHNPRLPDKIPLPTLIVI